MKKWLWIAVAAAAAMPLRAEAQTAAERTGPGGGAPTPTTWPQRDHVHLQLSAQRVERPELEFQLLPRLIDMDPGNAAVKYQAAAAELPALSADELRLVQDLGRDLPLEMLDPYAPPMKAVFDKCSTSLRLLREGSRLESADWETNVARDGVNAIIPSLTKFRLLSSILATQIRLDIRHHDWAAAQDKLQTGYMLARHIGEGETLVEALVGVSIASRMNAAVEDWIAEPGSPNLYWPLSNLPAPFNDLHRAMEHEQSFSWVTLPELKEMRAGHFSADLWNSMVAHMASVAGGSLPGPFNDLSGPLLGTALYPEAKRFLAARGAAPATLEKMPVAEVVGRYFVRSFEEEADGVFKWVALPPAQSLAGLSAWDKDFAGRAARGQVNLLARIMLPALSRAVQVRTRLDRQVAAFRILESLRAYAADHQKLPDTLDALQLPLPADPAGTGFHYRPEAGGMSAILSVDAVPPVDSIRYEITLRK